MKVYQEIAKTFDAYLRCSGNNNLDWKDRHYDAIKAMVNNGPSGSGWDCGTKLDFDRSNPEKLVFYGSFHHMDNGGGYDGWTEHSIIVKPSLIHGIDIKITGVDRNDIKDYLGEIFDSWLSEEMNK